MSSTLRFLSSTTIRGLFIFLPIIIIVLLLGELLDLVVALATPIVDTTGIDVGENPSFPALLAIVIIGLVSFFVGLLSLLRISQSTGQWLEARLLIPIPGYLAIKNLLAAFRGSEQVESFKPALLKTTDDQEDIVFLIEEHAAGRSTVLVPFAPTPMAGHVRIVRSDRLTLLDASLGQVFDVLSQWGVGSSKVLESTAKN
jgi:uncharacterized membrane protein